MKPNILFQLCLLFTYSSGLIMDDSTVEDEDDPEFLTFDPDFDTSEIKECNSPDIESCTFVTINMDKLRGSDELAFPDDTIMERKDVEGANQFAVDPVFAVCQLI